MAAAPEGVDVAIVGAGAIGLACAARLASEGRSVVVLERGPGIAQETTSRNSEVVHAGLYYPTGSLKAELCCEGREALYARCTARGIPHRRIGKLIVATDASETRELERLHALGTANGVPGLELIDAQRVAALEPALRAVAALHSPETGIVDGHALSLSYLAEAEAKGADLVLHTRVEEVTRSPGGYRLEARGEGGEAQSLQCAALVNAAGLESARIAELAGVDVDEQRLRLHLCKGDYFSLAPGSPLRVSRLVYPVPAGPGLGIHATLDLGGRIRFGPDTEYVDRVEYAIDPGKAADFARAIARYLPGIDADWLAPDYAGIRPKLSGPGEPFRDFEVREESAIGLPGLVNCIGIESPGLTASAAIARRVAELLRSL